MARDLHDIISDTSQGSFEPPFQGEGSDDAFLQLVIQPIYSVMQKVFSHMFLLNVIFV
jgi:callose synthase